MKPSVLLFLFLATFLLGGCFAADKESISDISLLLGPRTTPIKTGIYVGFSVDSKGKQTREKVYVIEASPDDEDFEYTANGNALGFHDLGGGKYIAKYSSVGSDIVAFDVVEINDNKIIKQYAADCNLLTDDERKSVQLNIEGFVCKTNNGASLRQALKIVAGRQPEREFSKIYKWHSPLP